MLRDILEADMPPRKTSRPSSPESIDLSFDERPSHAHASHDASHSPVRIILVVLAVVALAGVLLARPWMGRRGSSSAGAASEAADLRDVNARVARHIQVAEGETPSVATVQDADRLKAANPAFYRYAQNGDRLLVYSDKAVLYSTSQDKLLAVMPVVVQPQVANQEQAVAQSQRESVRLEVRNGSGITGLAKTVAGSLTVSDAGLQMSATAGDAKSRTAYAKTVLVVPSGKAQLLPTAISRIRQATGAEVVESLAAEGTWEGDLLLVLGKDQASR